MLRQHLDEVVNTGYGQTVSGFLRQNLKSLKIVEEVIYHLIATKRCLKAKIVFLEKQLAEVRCLANLGDYIRLELYLWRFPQGGPYAWTPSIILYGKNQCPLGL